MVVRGGIAVKNRVPSFPSLAIHKAGVSDHIPINVVGHRDKLGGFTREHQVSALPTSDTQAGLASRLSLALLSSLAILFLRMPLIRSTRILEIHK